MVARIMYKPDDLAQQYDRVYHLIVAESNWPVTAPIAMTLLTRSQNINTQLSVINSLKSQLRDARQVLKPFVEDTRADMIKVNQATDPLYGPNSANKIQICLDPKKPAKVTLTQMIGNATVTASELEIQGLERGKQYWFRVRAVKASNTGPWSDQATRVAKYSEGKPHTLQYGRASN